MNDNQMKFAFMATYLFFLLTALLIIVIFVDEFKRDEVLLAAVKDNGCSTSQIEVKEKSKKYIDEYAIENL